MRRLARGASAIALVLPLVQTVPVGEPPHMAAPTPPPPPATTPDPASAALVGPTPPAASERASTTTSSSTMRSSKAEPSRSSGGELVDATAYCLTGTMADGHAARLGAVAADRWRLGTRLEVDRSPGVGSDVVVEDRIGSGSELDFALPGACGAARAWGRQVVRVEVLAA